MVPGSRKHTSSGVSTRFRDCSGQSRPILPDLIVQEWIEGDDSDIYFCLALRWLAGKPVISFAGQKITLLAAANRRHGKLYRHA